MKRNIYLENTELEKALDNYFKSKEMKTELKVSIEPVSNCLGMVTAQPIYAKYSSPNHNAAAMDGIAVISSKTFYASEVEPVILLENQDFIYVNTGNVIKQPYDAVIMVEDIVVEEDGIKIYSPATPWQHIRPIGEDIVIGDLILPTNHQIRPIDIGAIYSCGVQEIAVYEQVKVGIVPTGNEIIQVSEPMEEGKIFDSNSQMFAGLIKERNALPTIYSTSQDEHDALKNAVLKAVEENHVIIVNAGSSAGSKDYTKAVIEELGTVLYHGIAIKPGKPTILGMINQKPVIGIPGYPVSAYFVYQIFVDKILEMMQKYNHDNGEIIKAKLSKRVISSIKHREFVRMKLGVVEDQVIATPLDRGAGVLMSLVKADGILEIPQNSEGLNAGEFVQIKLTKKKNQIENTLVSIGSHDMILDVIDDLLHKYNNYISLSSAHTGSMGGIMAMMKNECHIAPVHLLDEKTGKYNMPYVQRYFNPEEVVIIKGVTRQQGIMVRKDQELKINDINDFTNPDVSIVNRQKGSGTRILFDYKLKQTGINKSDIRGYDHEVNTHTAVAAAVVNGNVDAGIGVYTVANSFDLDFYPIGEESYDFIAMKSSLNDHRVKAFIEIITSEVFKKQLKELGGYGYEDIGKIIEVKGE